MSNKNAVFVLDVNRNPCNPVHPAVARKLLSSGKAAVFHQYPFTIILKEESTDKVKDLRIKIDPGAKFTGLALVSDTNIVWAAELEHRGFAIRDSLTSRRQQRQSRRQRKTRYRKPRFLNRRRPEGWLPPSLMSRVYNIQTWVNRLCKLAPVKAISQELVKFDTQKMINPEVKGVEYQRGELLGYEVRQYLLEKFNHTCVYCGATDKPFNLDHFHPKSKGGSNKVSNLVLSCVDAFQAKGNKLPAEFLSNRLHILTKIDKQRRKPLADAAAVNATRWKLKETLEATGLPVELGSGGLTKYNRKRLRISKSHWTDAACVGESTPESLNVKGFQPLIIKAMGRGSRQMVNSDKYGFPRGVPKSKHKFVCGFQTGDMVKAVIPKGKYTGTHTGRIAVRYTGSFKLKTKTQNFSVNHKYCHHIHKSDGFSYGFGELVKQKAKVVKPIINQQINPTQLSLFDMTEFSTQTTQTQTKRSRKFKGTEGEQLSLF